MSVKTPSQIRKDIDKTTREITQVMGLLHRYKDQKSWGIGVECSRTWLALKNLLDNNEIPTEYKVAVVGRFKAGKSSFVNELLGRRLAGEDTSPETAAVTTFRHGEQVRATIRFIRRADWESLKTLFEEDPKNPNAQRVANWKRFLRKEIHGHGAMETEHFDLEQLERDFLTEEGHALSIVLDESGEAKEKKKKEAEFRKAIKRFTSGAKPYHCLVESIEITAPSLLLKEGVLLIDTPGLDDTERFRVNLTERAVQDIDAVLFLTKSGAAYGQSEKDFLLSLLRKGTIKRLVFVITQVDQTYEQHVRQARDQDEDHEPLADRIATEHRRIQAEIDATLTALDEDNNSQAMLRYREQLGNIEIMFTSAANHRDWKASDPVRYPLSSEDPGGLESIKRTLLNILSTESRLATTAHNIQSGARSLLDGLVKLIESRRSSVRNLKNREVAEQKLGTFRNEFAEAGEEFSSLTSADAELLVQSLANREKLAQVSIENIALLADAELATYELHDMGRHWKTRRNGGWGYMYEMQRRVANRIFPRVTELLNGQTAEFSNFVEKFQTRLHELSQTSARIIESLELVSEVRLDVESRLRAFLEQMLVSLHELMQAEEGKIIGLLDEFVSEEVQDRITNARESVSGIWGRGTTAGQSVEVRKFYKEVKAILREALTSHIQQRYDEFASYLCNEAKLLPGRALSEVQSELDRAQQNIRAAAEAAIHGQKESFEQLANEIVSALQAALAVIEEGAGAPQNNAQEVEVVVAKAVSGLIDVDGFERIRAGATQCMARFTLGRAETRWSYRRIFEDRFLQGATTAAVIDPYLVKPYQMRNLMEFIDRVREVMKLRSLLVITGDNADAGSAGSDDRFGELASQLHRDAGIYFDWRHDLAIHDRYVIFDNGVLFKLGRGLDIFQTANGLALANQSLRRVKACQIDVFRVPEGHCQVNENHQKF